jgi:hypothetical protein
VVNTTRSAGTFKLGLHDNMEGGACTHNLTKTCVSKTQWFDYHNICTEREKIKSELSTIHTQQNTQQASRCKQNHEKKLQKYKINDRNDNTYTNVSKCCVTNHLKGIKNENITKKYKQKYNTTYSTLEEKTGHPLNNRRQEGVNKCIKQYKLTNDTECHLFKNDILIIIKAIKYTTHHNTTKHTQQNNIKIITHTNNTQIYSNKRMTLDTKCHMVWYGMVFIFWYTCLHL